jgi:archaellum component FlaD/FlaE
MNIIDYSQGITEKEKKEETTKKQITDLPSKDHIQSLIYIQKLKGMQFDKHFIDRIENELSRISKKIDSC